jgi:hypothetical protein
MAVDLRLMRYVIAVAEEGGFQRAADRWELRLALPLASSGDPEQNSWQARTDSANWLGLCDWSTLGHRRVTALSSPKGRRDSVRQDR